MEAPDDVSRRSRMIQLNEIVRESELPKKILSINLPEESSFVLKNFMLEYDQITNRRADDV